MWLSQLTRAKTKSVTYTIFMRSETPVTAIKGVGEGVAQKLAILGIQTIGDLINTYPRSYNDYSQQSAIKSLRPGAVTIRATVTQVTGRYVRRGMHITEAMASDDTGSTRLVWFNQPYRERAIKKGEYYYISGNYELRQTRFSIMNPSMELTSEFPLNTARIVSIYRETKGLSSNQLRRFIKEALPLIHQQPETLPAWLVAQEALLPRAVALESMHFPADAAALASAQKRLGFEEVLELTLASLLNKHELLQDTSLAINFDEKLARQFVSHLPFKLTDAQRKVVWRVYQDMQKTQPMNRLVEGDVGSGKTVVATMAALMAMAQGFQVALMAPTELLARQHADTVYGLLAPLSLQAHVALLVGGMNTAQKNAAYAHIAAGEAQFIIGTHALIQEKVDMHRLGLVIVDEQHRFGVAQRQKLMAKAGHMPHLLSLTATPIPRSLALTLYGELDVSIIDTKPPGRQPIITEICSPNSRDSLNAKINAEIDAGRQMFVVCPLITESATMSARSAEAVYEQFSQHEFKSRRVGLLHGKMKPADKQAVMQQFTAHELDILVSTTVIEVGVDVPNASIMLIEAADRFGLAQIHQLRGRVGRGGHQGFCYLMMSDSSAPPARLKALERTNDGFKLAELDLSLRGPGAIYGTMQHGQLDLRVAKLTDVALISRARSAAQTIIDRGEDLVQYKQLFQHVSRLRAVTNLN
jgi:ATP-dependent DNA helicase RecG